MTTFERINKIAKRRGMAITEVSKKAGVGANTIYRWKHQTPNVEKLELVAKVLGTSLAYLLGETDDPSPLGHDEKPTVDLAGNDFIMTFEGRPIPPEDLELMKRLLRGGRNDE